MDISKDLQIKKFCLYGFLKNMKFFEPYFIVFFLHHNITFLQIGLLMAIKEIIINIFEIPSGLFADYFGRKKEMYMCFIFFILSFIAFYFTTDFLTAVIGMVFYGLGDAFRTGTHKAMIYSYLDHKGWGEYKTQVYGKTHGYSLIGSSISSFLAIILIIYIEDINRIFLFSIVPYILDFLLISSYPKFLDLLDKKENESPKSFILSIITTLKDVKLKKLVVQESMSDATISYSRDMLQPILQVGFLAGGFMVFSDLNANIGLMFAIFNFLGALSSTFAYKFQRTFTNYKLLKYIQITLIISIFSICVFINQPILVCIIYCVFFMSHSVRKPVCISEIDNIIDKSNRATILSIVSQLKSLILIVISPILGYFIDNYSIVYALILLCFFNIAVFLIIYFRNSK